MHTIAEYKRLEDEIKSLMEQHTEALETDIDQSVNLAQQCLNKSKQVNKMELEDEEEKRQNFEALVARVNTLEEKMTTAEAEIVKLKTKVTELEAKVAPPAPPAP